MNPFTPRRNADLRHWRPPVWNIIARDSFAALCVAAVILGGSFAAGVITQLLKGIE